MKRVLPIAVVSVTLLVAAAPVRGQVTGVLDAGVAGSSANSQPVLAGWAVSPSLGYQTARLRLLLDAQYQDQGHPGSGLAGLLSASHFTRLGGPLLAELTGGLKARSGPGGDDGAAWEFGGRLHYDAGRAGAWLGSQAGRGPHGATLRWEAAAWRRLGGITIQLSGSQIASVASVRQSATVSPPDTLRPSLDSLIGSQVRTTTDLGAWFRWSPAPFALAAGIGQRYGVREVAANVLTPGLNGDRSVAQSRATTRTTWWLADATYWLAPRLGLHATVGRSPPDLQFGTSGGRFLRLGFQTSLGASRSRPGIPVAYVSTLSLRRASQGMMTVELHLAESDPTERVELMADFTDWRPVAMKPVARGRWQVQVPAAAGMHFLNIRTDGGSWRPPPGVRVVTDEFGQLTGVVVVEG